MNIVTEKLDEVIKKDMPNNNVRVTEIRLTIDNMVVLVLKLMAAFLIVGIIIGVAIAVISFVSIPFYEYFKDLLGL